MGTTISLKRKNPWAIKEKKKSYENKAKEIMKWKPSTLAAYKVTVKMLPSYSKILLSFAEWIKVYNLPLEKDLQCK